MTQEQVAALQDQGEADFTDAERAAIDSAEELTRTSALSDKTFARLKKHFNDRQIIEITVVACTFNYTNRFNAGLDMDLTVYPEDPSR